MGALALAQVAQHRGVDRHLFGDAGRAFAEIQPHPKQRVRAGPDPPDRPAAAGSAAEERLEHVAQATKATESTCRRGGVLQRITAEVDDAALLRVGQHLVGGADLLELVLGLFVGVDVGMQLAGQFPIGALDLRIACAPAHPEQAVVIACHA